MLAQVASSARETICLVCIVKLGWCTMSHSVDTAASRESIAPLLRTAAGLLDAFSFRHGKSRTKAKWRRVEQNEEEQQRSEWKEYKQAEQEKQKDIPPRSCAPVRK